MCRCLANTVSETNIRYYKPLQTVSYIQNDRMVRIYHVMHPIDAVVRVKVYASRKHETGSVVT